MSVVSLLNSCSSTTCALWKLKNPLTSWKELRPSSRNGVRLGNYHSTNWINKNGFKVKAFFNPTDDPIIKQALKEPVSFMGGMFAGLLRLDLNEDPLKEWVTRTAEASGIVEEEIDADAEGSKTDEVPQQIEIE
ncbi:UPF0426 protein At1g28150, chloroplastic [Quercus robur]|nr:UPF0426 protein At1g28150, chloroplastic-like isoform X2 [Quercus lobata]XP_050256734.1 UPF0426 protein At1g28150, chloroplastic [Quercus robur]